MTIPINPHQYATAYDTVTIDGKQSPGLAEVRGAAQIMDWDVQKGIMLSGAFVRYTGDNLAKFTITIKIGYDGFGGKSAIQQWEAWEEFKKVIAKPPRGARPTAKSIWHPWLAELGIMSMVIEERSQFEEVAPSVWATTIKCLQFRGPVPAGAQPKISEPAQDPIEQYISGLREQKDALADRTNRNVTERKR